MPKEVVVTERARIEYLAVVKYLSEAWTVKEIEKFEQKFLKAVSIIKTNPKTFVVTRKNIRKYVLDKNNIIYFRIRIDTVEIISVWATRKNPKKLRL